MIASANAVSDGPTGEGGQTAKRPDGQLKRRVLMIIMALSFVSSAAGWAAMEAQGNGSSVLRAVFASNLVFHPVLFTITWRRLVPLAVVEWSCLAFAGVVCAGCMALGLYMPSSGIDLQPLYLWIPIVYVFAFTLPKQHRQSLGVSVALFAVFVAISLPYLFSGGGHPNVNFTVQLHMVSAVLIAALYFFAGHMHRYQLAQLTLDQLARMANTDELTGIANRRRMLEALPAERLRYARYGHAFSVILIDIDHFKLVNDRFGHRVGDEALIAVARCTQSGLRDVDMLGRWGGEEFLVVLPQTGFEEALAKAEALVHHVATSQAPEAKSVTISCGVATVVDDDTIDTLLHRADVALYQAKNGGRNRAEGATDRHPGLDPAHA